MFGCVKRNVLFKAPLIHKKTPQKSFILRRFSMINICISRKKILPLYSINWGLILSNVEFKLYVLIPIKQLLGAVYIVLVYMDVAEVKRYTF